jgi:hypothetical protein
MRLLMRAKIHDGVSSIAFASIWVMIKTDKRIDNNIEGFTWSPFCYFLYG